MKKTVLIYNSSTLVEIFREIKDNLDFNFFVWSENTVKNLDSIDQNNYIIISHTPNNIKNLHVFNVPMEIKTLLEKINIWFLAKKFSSQSSIKVGSYYLDLNSRKISIDEKFLNYLND